MKPVGFLIIPVLLANSGALAGSVDGNGALALAALVAENSPSVKTSGKILLEGLLNGRSSPPGVYTGYEKKITVTADGISCKTSNVDITVHQCDLTFGAKRVTTKGRRAHELYATLAEIGVAPDGAAGSIFEAVSNLDCTIDPNEVKQKAGGGAHCAFSPAK